MNTPELGSIPERLRTTPESIFPLDIEMLANRLELFEESSDAMLTMITEARGKWGKASDIYHNFPVEDFKQWHEQAGDFTDRAELQYRVGLLYGMDLAQSARMQHYMTSELEADDPDAYEQALKYLKETYRQLDDDPKLNWIRQKNRELRYTGSDVLTLANATLQDTIYARIGRKVKTDEELFAMAADASAMHVGLVDGAIFVNALHSFAQDKEPSVFEKTEMEYVPTLDSARHAGHGVGSEDDYCGLIPRFQFEAGDFSNAVESLKKSVANDEATLPAEYYRVDLRDRIIDFGPERLVQTTPNEFVLAREAKRMGYRWLSKKVMGAYALIGVGVDVVSALTIDSKVGLIPAGTAAVAGLIARQNRKHRKDAQRRAENINIQFIGRVK